MKKAITLLLVATCAATAANASSILSLRESIADSTIIYPESFETDTHKMMQNWYLQNYAVLDTTGGSSRSSEVADEVYIQRLAALPTTIEMPYNQIVRSYINMYVQKKRELVEAMLGMSLYYLPIFEQALERHDVPLELRYLPVIESAINPDAVSRAGATGLWQFMLATARGLGLEISTLVDERRDPYASSEAAATYLRQLFDIYGDWSLAIAAYNCGPGNVNKALRRAGLEEKKDKDFWQIYYFLPQETRGYVPAFIAANYVMTYYNHHGISPALARRPIVTDSVHVTKRVHFNQIAQVLNIPVEEIRVLNPQYRKDIIPGDVRPYSLVLPSMQVYSYIMSEDSIVARDASRYGRRTVVEPTTPAEIDANSEFTTKLVVKTHTVQRGETLSKIAKKYGVTVADIKKWNGLKKDNIARGRKLKIHTYQRVRVARPAAQPEAPKADDTPAQDTAAPADTAAIVPAAAALADTAAAPDPTPAPAAAPAPAKKKTTAQQQPAKKKKSGDSGSYTTYKVRKGDSLYSIAKAKGTTVEALRRANGISGSKLQVGQTIKIPK